MKYRFLAGVVVFSALSAVAQNSFTPPTQEPVRALLPISPADSIVPYKVGDRVEDFRLQNVDGRFVSLRDYPDAKGFVIVFTCNNCPCATDYQKRLIWMAGKYETQDFPVVAINANRADRKFGESLADMAARADTSGFNFPYLFDENQAVARRYGAIKTPEAFVVVRDEGEDWAYRLIYSGAIDDKPADQYKVKRFYIGEAIAMHQQSQPLATTRVEPMGCTIEGVGLAGKNCPMQALEDRVKEALSD